MDVRCVPVHKFDGEIDDYLRTEYFSFRFFFFSFTCACVAITFDLIAVFFCLRNLKILSWPHFGFICEHVKWEIAFLGSFFVSLFG